MGWATEHIKNLSEGKTVQFRPKGNSMSGKIESGELVTVEPINWTQDGVDIGDIVLCKIHGRQYLHLIQAQQGMRFKIGNNKGYTNGWTSWKSIYGIVTKVEK